MLPAFPGWDARDGYAPPLLTTIEEIEATDPLNWKIRQSKLAVRAVSRSKEPVSLPETFVSVPQPEPVAA